jgi:hypothetical protein
MLCLICARNPRVPAIYGRSLAAEIFSWPTASLSDPLLRLPSCHACIAHEVLVPHALPYHKQCPALHQSRTRSHWLGRSVTLCAGATLGSFLIALLHFLMELVLFQTMTLKFALQPMIVAGASLQAMLCCAVRPLCLPGTASSQLHQAWLLVLHSCRHLQLVDGAGLELLHSLRRQG